MADQNDDPIRQAHQRRAARSQAMADRVLGTGGGDLTPGQIEILRAFANKRITTRQLVDYLGAQLAEDENAAD